MCAPAGALAGLVATELVNEGIITKSGGKYFYAGEEIEAEALWMFLLTFSNGILYAKIPSESKKFDDWDKIKIVEMEDKDFKKWVVYGVKESGGKPSEVKLGTVEEILNGKVEETKAGRDLVACGLTAGVTFTGVSIVHILEAKDEIVGNEREKCRNTVCFKGKTHPPIAPDNKDKLMEAMNNNKICGIKIMNANETLGKTDCRGGPCKPTHEFYLVSPCFAYAQVWVGDCKYPDKICTDSKLCPDWKIDKCKSENACCRKCLWVSLMEAKGLDYQEDSAFNYCALGATPRSKIIEYAASFLASWPTADYWGKGLV